MNSHLQRQNGDTHVFNWNGKEVCSPVDAF